MTRKVPGMPTDQEAEAFLAQDLSDLDFSQFKRVKFDFEAKSAQLNMRLPQSLLDAVKQSARRATCLIPGSFGRCWSRLSRRGSGPV
jgi:predicted DNA binding CopG/RHH family protein